MICLEYLQHFMPSIEIPVFENQALKQWSCLFQWSGSILHSNLPKIRDRCGMEITILSSKVPKFMVKHPQLSTDKYINIGEFISMNTRVTSDPNELSILLEASEHGTLLLPLIRCYSKFDVPWVITNIETTEDAIIIQKLT